ncbi:MAG: hypothetical protein ACLUZX_02840 [Subdoligranulum sp.]
MRNDSDRLQWQTEKGYIMNTFHNGLRRIQTDSKTAQQYVLLCLALAVAALIMVSGGSGEDVISVVFRPFVNFIRVIAWLGRVPWRHLPLWLYPPQLVILRRFFACWYLQPGA